MTGCKKKLPLIVVELLPNWSHNFGELKKELDLAPNMLPYRPEAAPQREANVAGSLMTAANGPSRTTVTKKRKPNLEEANINLTPQDVEAPDWIKVIPLLYCSSWKSKYKTFEMSGEPDVTRTPEEDTDDEIKSTYKPPPEKTIEEILAADQEDESLRKYKEKLLGEAQQGAIIVDANDPRKVIVKKLALCVEGRDDVELDLSGDLTDLKKQPHLATAREVIVKKLALCVEGRDDVELDLSGVLTDLKKQPHLATAREVIAKKLALCVEGRDDVELDLSGDLTDLKKQPHLATAREVIVKKLALCVEGRDDVELDLSGDLTDLKKQVRNYSYTTAPPGYCSRGDREEAGSVRGGARRRRAGPLRRPHRPQEAGEELLIYPQPHLATAREVIVKKLALCVEGRDDVELDLLV
ncbi:RHO protein GDP dissociation inhibitor domain-containing protein [Phthorimaea operculella]|nr:RHO protein GDP dissociation inhibitor domain-containing protein [Phthorimaea operculella]